MRKNKETLAAGTVYDIRFKDLAAYNNYIEKLKLCKVEYEVLERYTCEDGTVLARIVEDVFRYPLIKLWD